MMTPPPVWVWPVGSLSVTSVAGAARLGYSAQEIAEVSDRLVDAIVGYGDPAAIAAKVREHVAAGADHVVLMPPGGDFTAELEQLAPALAEVGPASYGVNYQG